MTLKDAETIAAAQALYEHTKDECGKCRAPHSCCSREYCGMALEIAKEEWGTDLSAQFQAGVKIPFLHTTDGVTACVVPPHMRPLCTLHTCDINNLGFKRDDPSGQWTKVYFTLREKFNTASMERYPFALE